MAKKELVQALFLVILTVSVIIICAQAQTTTLGVDCTIYDVAVDTQGIGPQQTLNSGDFVGGTFTKVNNDGRLAGLAIMLEDAWQLWANNHSADVFLLVDILLPYNETVTFYEPVPFYGTTWRGVIYNVDPVSGAESHVIGEYSWGLIEQTTTTTGTTTSDTGGTTTDPPPTIPGELVSIMVPVSVAAVAVVAIAGFIKFRGSKPSGLPAAEMGRVLVVCPYCGAKTEQGVLQCSKCGADL